MGVAPAPSIPAPPVVLALRFAPPLVTIFPPSPPRPPPPPPPLAIPCSYPSLFLHQRSCYARCPLTPLLLQQVSSCILGRTVEPQPLTRLHGSLVNRRHLT